MLNGTERVLWRGASQPGVHVPWGSVPLVTYVVLLALLGSLTLRDLWRAHDVQSLAIIVGLVLLATVVAVLVVRAAPVRQYLLTTERVMMASGRSGTIVEAWPIERLGLVWRAWNVDDTGSIWFEFDGTTRFDASDSRRRAGFTANGIRDIADARRVFEMIQAAHAARLSH